MTGADVAAAAAVISVAILIAGFVIGLGLHAVAQAIKYLAGYGRVDPIHVRDERLAEAVKYTAGYGRVDQ